MRSAIFLFGLMLASIILAQHISSKAEAAQNIRFGNGYYINLSGAGADTNGNIGGYNDEADCNTGSGTCTAKNRNNGQNYDGGTVYKYVCSGLITNCDNTHALGRVVSSSSAYSQSIDGNLGCDQTVQLDVFDRNNALRGYMTWYSGACSQNANNITVCTGRVVSQAQLESELRGAGYPGPWGDVNTELQAFNRAACPSGVSATPAPSYTVTTCNGRTLSQSQLESELRGANYPGPWGDINTELQAFNRAACPRYATPQPTAAPVYGGTTTYYIYQTPYPTPTPQTIYKTNTTYIKHAAYSAPTPTAYPKPQTQTYESKGGTLPQTGSPIANFLYFASLVPAGLLLKKLGSVVS